MKPAVNDRNKYVKMTNLNTGKSLYFACDPAASPLEDQRKAARLPAFKRAGGAIRRYNRLVLVTERRARRAKPSERAMVLGPAV